MKTELSDLNFYKYCSDETKKFHFWESETSIMFDDVVVITKKIKESIPSAKIEQVEKYHKFYNLNVKLYSDEDNAFFCLLMGKSI